ncbi:hypothetical protein [Noviherbaspirillum massiliense]|uniref:hypothetical protein n=1 Tax=Noviherbaspirillum massiliense TaxID=1465823 RepID=UPI0011DDD571|nr:hypothetical protein [Noviherbaspirillum massiliense]
MKYDLDGPLFDDRDVLDHLLHLALDNGDVAAGRVVLNPKKYGMLIGAETSEDIAGTYIIPLIRGYKDLQALIDAPDYKNLAQRICSWSAEEHDFRAANDLILELTRHKNLPFASSLSTKCRAEKQLMKKHGEEFTE